MSGPELQFCEECGAPWEGEATLCAACQSPRRITRSLPPIAIPSVPMKRPDWMLLVGLAAILLGIGLTLLQRQYYLQQAKVLDRRFVAPQQPPPPITLPTPPSTGVPETPVASADEEDAHDPEVVDLPTLFTTNLPSAADIQQAGGTSEIPEARRRALYKDLTRIRWQTRNDALKETFAPILAWQRGTSKELVGPLMFPEGKDAYGQTSHTVLFPGAMVTLEERRANITGYRCRIGVTGYEAAWVDGWNLLDALQGHSPTPRMLEFSGRQQVLESAEWDRLSQKTGLPVKAFTAILEEGLEANWEMDGSVDLLMPNPKPCPHCP